MLLLPLNNVELFILQGIKLKVKVNLLSYCYCLAWLM